MSPSHRGLRGAGREGRGVYYEVRGTYSGRLRRRRWRGKRAGGRRERESESASERDERQQLTRLESLPGDGKPGNKTLGINQIEPPSGTEREGQDRTGQYIDCQRWTSSKLGIGNWEKPPAPIWEGRPGSRLEWARRRGGAGRERLPPVHSRSHCTCAARIVQPVSGWPTEPSGVGMVMSRVARHT